MATMVNIFNQEWCELVFVQKNHKYGAFQIRQTTGKRHLLAIAITLSSIGLVFLTPSILKSRENQNRIINDDVIEVSKIPTEKVEKNDVIYEEQQQIRKNFRESVEFVPPLITEDENVGKDEYIPTMDSLTGTDAGISNVTYKGVPGGTDLLTEDILPSTNTTDFVDFVEQMPQYPGGESELLTYLGENLRYPQIAIDNGMSGTVHVQFVVFSNGEIGNIKVLRGFEQNCEKEAMRVIKSMKKWIPGKQNGNPVNVRMSLPVKFILK